MLPRSLRRRTQLPAGVARAGRQEHLPRRCAQKSSGFAVPISSPLPTSSHDPRIFTPRVGATDSDTLLAKSALFTYYLLDAGHQPEGPPAQYAALPSCLPTSTALEVRSAWLLDDAGDRPQAADEAARLVPAAAGPLTPFKFVKALAARGLPDAALSLVRFFPCLFFAHASGCWRWSKRCEVFAECVTSPARPALRLRSARGPAERRLQTQRAPTRWTRQSRALRSAWCVSNVFGVSSFPPWLRSLVQDRKSVV